LGLLCFLLAFWEATLPARCMFRVKKHLRAWWIGCCWIGVWWLEGRRMIWCLNCRLWKLD
jgi:hypothetical protein